jgi:hypothetical protein
VTVDRELMETTVERLGGVRVGIGNIFEDEYELPDGSTARGPSAHLVELRGEDPNPAHVVGAGSVVAIGDARFEVLDVLPHGAGSGSLKVRELES